MIGALTGAGLNAHWAGLYKEMTHGINVGHVRLGGGSARPIARHDDDRDGARGLTRDAK